MKPNQPKRNKFQRWLHRNSPLLFIIGVFIFGVLIGAITVSLSVNLEAVDDHSVESESVVSTITSNFVYSTPRQLSPNEPPVVCDPISEEVHKIEQFYFDVPLSHDLQDYIRELCEGYDVPMSLIIALIDTESSFRPGVVSGTNDYGLMQINSINHQWLSEELGVTDFLDPYDNVLCGIYIISGHLKKTDGDVELALMRYNCGATGAMRLWDQGIYSTTYTRKVMAAYESYKEKAAPVR